MTRKPGKSSPSETSGDADASLPESLMDLPEGRMPADAGEADDLLASLADEEINRLTLDEPPPGAADDDADEAETGFAELTPDEAAALRAEGDDPPPPITQDSPEDDSVTSMPTDEELDALLRGEDPEAAQALRLEVEPGDAEEEEALSDAAAELAAELDSQPENAGTAEAEDDVDIVAADEAVEARRGINAVEPKAAVADHPEPAAAPQPIAGAPWLLKPLIWLNAPLARAPEPVRDLIGKIALITLLNAVAVFVYVFIIRR